MTTDPNKLMGLAKCLRCIPRGMLREVQVMLLCEWANHMHNCGEPSNTIVISGAGDASMNATYTFIDILNGKPHFTNAIAGDILWNAPLALPSNAWVIQNVNTDVCYYTSNILFPCQWTVDTVPIGGFDGVPPAPTGKYI